MNLVIWGHEHESIPSPRPNAETGFDIVQPGSTVATSLIKSESEPKHACILSITGRDYKSEAIRLKSVRPFKIRDIALAEDQVTKRLAKKDDNRTDITKRLVKHVEELIEEANMEWRELHENNESEEEVDPPLPLIRLRVEYTAPDGGSFDCENPQRFSNRFTEKVANTTDVVQFWRRKTTTTRKTKSTVELPEDSALQSVTLDSVKVGKLVREFLTAQSLTILPQNSFGDAVNQFVDKDDKHAMELFVDDSLKSQVEHLLSLDGGDDKKLQKELESNKSHLEKLFAEGRLRTSRGGKLKPKPGDWDTDEEGKWEDQPGAWERSDFSDSEENDDDASVTPAPEAAKRGGRGGRGRGTGMTRSAPAKKATAAAKKAPATTNTTRGRRKQVVEEEDNDVVMDDANDQDDSQLYPLFVRQNPSGGAKSTSKSSAALTKRQPTRKAATASSSRGTGVNRNTTPQEISDDISDDDDDAFEISSAPTRSRGKR